MRTLQLHCLALSVRKTCGVISPMPSCTGENLMNTSASGLSYRQEASCWHASSGKLRFGIVSNDSLPRSPCIITTSSRTGSYSRSNKADYPAKCLLKVMIMIKSRMFHLVFASELWVKTSFKSDFCLWMLQKAVTKQRSRGKSGEIHQFPSCQKSMLN